MLGGHEINIVGVKNSVLFHPQTRSWESTGLMAQRRWYGNANTLSDGRVLATTGNCYHEMVVFGGRNAADQSLRNYVDRYGLSTAGDPDPSMAPSGNWPVAREGHTLSERDEGPYYLFGGKGPNGLPSDVTRNDSWQLRWKDDDTQEVYEWAPINLGIGVTPPLARWQHAAIVVPNPNDRGHDTLYLFGGQKQDGSALDDLWKLWWDPSPPTPHWQWTPITAQGTAPAARYGHTAAWNPTLNAMVIFGGKLGGGSLTGEVRLLSLATNPPTWKTPQLVGSSPPAPSARWLHAMTGDPVLSAPPVPVGGEASQWGRFFVFGGDQGAQLSNELWSLWVGPSGNYAQWQKVDFSTSDPVPAARKRASLIYNDEYLRVVVFGGETGGAADDHPWALYPVNGSAWSQMASLGVSLSGHAAFFEQRNLGALQPEVYDPATQAWSPVANPKYQFSYHFQFLNPDGNLFWAGPTFCYTNSGNPGFSTWRLNWASGTWERFPNDAANDTVRMDGGSAVMYRPGMVMKCGSTYNPCEPGQTLPNQALGRTVSIDLNPSDPNVHWTESVNKMLGRRDHNLEMLPTGDALVTGGTVGPVDNNDPWAPVPQRQPEIWNPDYSDGSLDAKGHVRRGYWYGRTPVTDDPPLPPGAQQLALEPVPRSHHSSAITLPDGRVLSAGGWDFNYDYKHTADIYCPPYLFKSDGGQAFRPRLYGAQDYIKWGQNFAVACPDPIVEACLIKPGFVTHGFNHDQRFVPLPVISQVGHCVTLQAPANGNLATPGDYLLFVMRQDAGTGIKVPSVARWVRLGSVQTTYETCDTLAPEPVTDLTTVSSTETSVTLRCTAPHEDGAAGGAAKRYEIRYKRDDPIQSLEEFFSSSMAGGPIRDPSTPGALDTLTVTGLLPGTVYYFQVMSRDDAGSSRNWSALSNQPQGLTQGGGGCPFVDTKTASGWQEENSILGRSLTGALALDDYRLLQAPAVENGRVRLRIRENEQELTTLDQVRLIALDHDPALEAFSAGERVVLGTRFPASRVTRGDGLDLTTSLTALGRGYFGQPGDTLLVELDAIGGGRSRPSGTLGAERTLPGGGGFEDGGGGKGGGGRSRPASATAVDAEVLASSGILIQAPDGAGGWRTVRTHYPREHYDRSLTDSLASGPVRLVFVGSHRLNYVGRVLYSPEELPAQKLTLRGATHNRLGDQMAAVDGLGNLTTAIAPGDTLELEFDWPAVPDGKVRDLFLLSRGVYTANLPAQQQGERLPTRFALRQNQPNPFANATTFRFDLPVAAMVKLELFDAQGRRIETLANRYYPAGSHAVEWSAARSAQRIGPGIYFYRIEAGPYRARRKMALLP